MREYPALKERCGGAWVAAKNESENPFGTAKDRRNAAVIMKYSYLNPLIVAQITSGNSGYSIGMLARELDPSGKKIKVVNIVGNGINPEIKQWLELCSSVYETDLTNGIINLPWMRKLARIATGYEGPEKNIVGVESFLLVNGYSSIVEEIYSDLSGMVPTHIFVPVGSGELLTEISHSAIKLYGDKCPKIVGNTIGNNVFASEEDRRGLKDLGSIADKLVNGFSNYDLPVRTLIQDGIAEIRVVDGGGINEEREFLAGIGIGLEPSAVVAFCGAFQYGLTKEDRAVIIGSGKGNYSLKEGRKDGVDKTRLGIGLGRTREESAYVVDNPEEKIALLERDLVEAAKSEAMKKMDELLADNAPTEGRDEYGSTPLSIAISKGNLTMVTKLIKAGANIEARMRFWDGQTQDNGKTPFAPTWGKEWVLGPPLEFIMLEYGWDTPLIRAATMPNPEILRALLDAKADVKAKDHFGRTALHWAAILGRTQNAKLLMERKAPNWLDHYGMRPVDYAAKFNRVELVREFTRADPRGECYWGTLEIACGEGNEDVVDALLETNVPVTEAALFHAVKRTGAYASVDVKCAYAGWKRGDNRILVEYGDSYVSAYPLARVMTNPPWRVFLDDIEDIRREFLNMKNWRAQNAREDTFVRIAERLITSGRINLRAKIEQIDYVRKPGGKTKVKSMVDPRPLRFLSEAARRGDIEMVKMLLCHHEKMAGREANARDFHTLIVGVAVTNHRGIIYALFPQRPMIMFLANTTPDINYDGELNFRECMDSPHWLSARTALAEIALDRSLSNENAAEAIVEIIEDLIKCGTRLDIRSREYNTTILRELREKISTLKYDPSECKDELDKLQRIEQILLKYGAQE